MGMIALQYLGARAARREQRRPAPELRPVPEGGRSSVGAERDPLDEVEMRLTYRTARVLGCIAEWPGCQQPGGRGERWDHRPGADLEAFAAHGAPWAHG